MAKIDEQTHRVLLLLKLDAQHLYERVQLRAPEYMLVFSMKRTREHFKEIFCYRYSDATIGELKLLSPELIIALDEFYTSVEEIKWHLFYTEDMPKTVEDWLYRRLALLEKKYFNLELYLNAEYEDIPASEIEENQQQDSAFSLEDEAPATPDDSESVDLDDL